MNGEFSPEDYARVQDIVQKLEDAMGGIGFYLEDVQVRAGIGPEDLAKLQETGVGPSSIRDVVQNDGVVLIDTTFQIGKVPFTSRVMMDKDDRQVKEMLDNNGLDNTSIEIDDIMSFDPNEEGDTNE